MVTVSYRNSRKLNCYFVVLHRIQTCSCNDGLSSTLYQTDIKLMWSICIFSYGMCHFTLDCKTPMWTRWHVYSVYTVIVIVNSHLYCSAYNACKDRWRITSNGDYSNYDNGDDNIDKIIAILVVWMLVIGPFEKPGLQATFESIRWTGLEVGPYIHTASSCMWDLCFLTSGHGPVGLLTLSNT